MSTEKKSGITVHALSAQRGTVYLHERSEATVGKQSYREHFAGTKFDRLRQDTNEEDVKNGL